MDLINETKPDYFRAQLWYCDPVTPIWEEREKYGIKGSAFTWSHDTMDSKTACELIDHVFLSQSEESSIWLPQFGFEQWSTYYLQRKGMTPDQLKVFLRCFNAAVKEKLLDPDRKEMSPDILENLRLSCQFDWPGKPDTHVLSLFSGARYQAAENFWIEMFDQCDDASSLESVRQENSVPDHQRETVTLELSPALTERLRLGFSVPLSEVILAAYSVLLSRLSGRQSTTIVSVSHERDARAVPLRLYPSWGMSFTELAETTAAKMREAAEHQLYAFHILTSPLRTRMHGGKCLTFDVGYAYGRVENGQRELGRDDPRKLFPAVGRGVHLLLFVEDDERSLHLRMSYPKNMFNRETIEKLISYLPLILEEVGDNPAALLEGLLTETEWKSHEWEVDSYAGESFNF